MIALLTSSGISSSLYKVDSSDASDERLDCSCGSGTSASAFFWFRLGLVSPEGTSVAGNSSPARLSVPDEADCCESCRSWIGVKGRLATPFWGLGVLDRDPATPYSRGPRSLPGVVLVGDVVVLLLLIVSETLPSRSRFSVDLKMSDSVESLDCCLPLCRKGVMGADRTGLAGGVTTGCGIRDAPYTYPILTGGLATRRSPFATSAGFGSSGSSLENACICA